MHQWIEIFFIKFKIRFSDWKPKKIFKRIAMSEY